MINKTALAKKPAKEKKPVERLAYTPGDAAIASSLSRQRIIQLIAEGKLKSSKVGRRTLVIASSLHRLINEGCSL